MLLSLRIPARGAPAGAYPFAHKRRPSEAEPR
jgi:hypothetical protein